MGSSLPTARELFGYIQFWFLFFFLMVSILSFVMHCLSQLAFSKLSGKKVYSTNLVNHCG